MGKMGHDEPMSDRGMPRRLGSGRRTSGTRHLPEGIRRSVRAAIVAGVVGMGLFGASDAGAQTTGAQVVGDPEAGRALAQRWCSSCHMTSATQEKALANGVPTFSGIARMRSTTQLSLRVFLQTPHFRMPDLHLTQTEIGDVTAYILSLRGL